MAGAKVGSNKKSAGKQRMLNGAPVILVLYNGKSIGHGKYHAGSVAGNLVCDTAGKPLPFKEVGELVG